MKIIVFALFLLVLALFPFWKSGNFINVKKNTFKSMKLLKNECSNTTCYELISVGNKVCISTSAGGIWCDDVGK